MRWRRSAGDDAGIEDRRGRRMPGGAIGGGVGGLGLVGILIAVLISVLGGGGGGLGIPDIGSLPAAPAPSEGALDAGPDPDEGLRAFTGFVVRDVQESWETAFARSGRDYRETTLVLFNGGVRTGCGDASSAVGPFYCPADRHVYLDLGFFRELRDRFGAPGDFAQAYVIAHEFGHHVQNLLGVMGQVDAGRRERPEDANELSVRLELQADCLAGVWAHSAYVEGQLEEGDLEEGLAAAAAVGDDRLQRQATGRVEPEGFTHGSSEQRVRWFQRGFDDGQVAACDTFQGDA